MDIPAGFEQWQWQQQQITQFSQYQAYRLIAPQQPEWSFIHRWYPRCADNLLNNYWVCEIAGQYWSFFRLATKQWVLAPIVAPAARAKSPLPLGMDLLSVTEQNGHQAWIFFSNKPIGLLQRQLKFRLSQLIDKIVDVNQPEDFWYLKNGQGRLVFSQQAEWTFVVLVK